MARYLGPKCRICRRLGTKLFLKSNRCKSEKCAVNKRKSAPGQKAQRLGKLTPYALQLKEKQKLKKMYGLLEKQFKNTFFEASRRKGVTGDNLLMLLETRLDNTVFRLSFANARNTARQLVMHGHIRVNNKKVDIPSYHVKVGDVISVTESSRSIKSVNDSLGAMDDGSIVGWLKLDINKYEGVVDHLPLRAEIQVPVNEQTVVELYSK